MANESTETSPISLYITKDYVICLDKVCMTRWDKDTMVNGVAITKLNIFFTEGPHVALEVKEGKKFIKALITYHELFASRKAV